MGSLLFCGGMIGTLLAGPLGDHFGRKISLRVGVTCFTALSLSSAFMPNFWTFVAARMCLGICLGGIVPIATTLLIETGTETSRGLTALSGQLLYQVGVAYVVVLAVFLIPDLKPVHWRELLLISSIPAYISSIMVWFFIDESPRFLSLKLRNKEAVDVLNRVARVNKSHLLDPQEEESISHIEQSSEIHFSDRIKKIFSGAYLRVTIQCFFLWWAVGFLYFGVVFILPRTLQSEASDSEVLPQLAIMNCIEAPAGILPMFIIEHKSFGRKNSIILTSLFQFITAVICSLPMDEALWAVFVTLFQFWGMVIGDIICPYTSELYETSIRTTGYSLCFTFTKLAAVSSPFILLRLHESNPMYPYYAFSVVGALSFINCALLQKDSKGKVLDTIVVAVN
mmetsp:Transcript_27137/g.26798  ORF Transcript_27137/g.26798 Transcript_27137/m.26798 type:complete len:396 (+) Transcript_27137:207-1394(+)